MNGNPLPPDVKKGQAHWSLIGAELHAMLGRVEYVDRAHTLSSTMACSNCCPDSYWALSIIPGPDVWFPVNNWQEFSFWQRNQDCYGVIGPPFPIDPTEWYWTIVEGEAQPEVYDIGYRIQVIVFGTMRRVLLFTHQVVIWVCTPVGTFPVYSYPHTSVDVSAYEFDIWSDKATLAPRPKSGTGEKATITIATNPSYSNVWVTFDTEIAVEDLDSGGHTAASHLNANPPATQAVRAARHGVLSSTGGYTDGYGRRQTLLEAPYAAGKVKVCAWLGSTKKCISPAIKVTVQPDLVRLGTSSKYYLKESDNCHESGDYHWGTTTLNSTIVSAGDKFWDDWGKNQTPKKRMVINDQSLKWGGLFDISKDASGKCMWNNDGSHETHRDGHHVDITFRVWGGSENSGAAAGDSIEIGSDKEPWKSIDTILKDKFPSVGYHPTGVASTSNHWHCRK